MTEQAAEPSPPAAPPVVLGPPAPKHESPLERAEDWFRDHGGQASQVRAAVAAGVTVADELKPLLQDHFAGVLALAAKVLSSPELRALAPEVLDLAESAARIGGFAL